MTVQYPITIKVSSSILEEFADSELPSFEDHQADPTDSGIPEGGRHGYEVLTEYKSQFKLRNPQELYDVWWRLCSGTFQLAHNHNRAARRLANELRPYPELDPNPEAAETLRKNPRPDGY